MSQACLFIALFGSSSYALQFSATCTGASSALPTDQCAAWIAFFDSAGGLSWSFCSDARTDPCSCAGYAGAYPVCSTDGTTVERVNMFEAGLNGTLPAAIGAWVNVTLFDVHQSADLTGTLPSTTARWQALTYFDLSDNHLSGAPGALGSSPLPALPFATMTNCALFLGSGTNRFACPWPAGAKEICTKYSTSAANWVPVTDADCTSPSPPPTPKPTPSTPTPPAPKPPTPPPPTPAGTYACLSGLCTESASGVSKAVCESVCVAPTFECISGMCTESASGVSKAVCASLCVAPTFECINGMCTESATGSSKAVCESVCKPEPVSGLQ